MTIKNAIFIGGGITLFGVVGFILFKNIKKKKELAQMMGGGSTSSVSTGSGSTSSGNTSSGNTSSVTTNADNYNTYSDRKILKDAMVYWLGTNEEAIDSLIARTTQEQRDKIRIDWDSNLSLYGGDTLKKWIEGDYSGSEEKRILKSFGY